MKTLNTLKLFIIASFIILLSSCEKDTYIVSKVYVKNDASKEFLIYVNYSAAANDSGQMVQLTPNQDKTLVDNYKDLNYDRTCSRNADRKIYIYNQKDSTYCLLNSSDFVADPNPSYAKTDNTSEIDESSQTIIYNFYVIINDELISRMTKNTAVTNKIF